MRQDVIPPLSDCVQLSVEQYRAKLYDIIRTEKVERRRRAEERGGERRASSHELRPGPAQDRGVYTMYICTYNVRL